MKHHNWVLLVMLCAATSLFAQGPTNKAGIEMSGTLCNSACVQNVSNRATCNTSCTDKTGDTVLVDDQGKVMKISNPKMATPHMNQHVKVMAVPAEKQREETLRLLEVSVN